jgi:hypothetical protein
MPPHIFVGTGMLCFNKRLGCIDSVSVLDSQCLDDIFDVINRDLNKRGPALYKYISTPLYQKFEKAADQLFG